MNNPKPTRKRIPPAAAGTTPARKKRSAAQQAASRKNGARGLGPKTAEGKRISSGNAITHGLLAKRIAPLPDARHEDKDFANQLKGLLDEFAPRTQFEVNLVESMAASFVKLARIGQWVEATMVNGRPTSEREGGKEEVAAKNLALAIATQDHFNRHEPLGLASEVLESMLHEIIALLSVMQRVSAPESPINGIDRKKIGAPTAKAVGEFLSGRQAIPPEHYHSWTVIFEKLVLEKRHHLKLAQQEDQKAEEDHRRRFMYEIPKLDDLEKLDRYDARCRRSLEKEYQLLYQLQQNRLKNRTIDS